MPFSLLAWASIAPASAAADAAAAVRIDELTVTATRMPERRLDVPQSVSVVDAEMIHHRGVRSTPESLQEEVGILVQETNLGGGSPFVRGQTGNRILVLIDGVRLNNSTYRFGPNQYLNTIDEHQVARLEVVRGPSSVLYGSDALGGVINVLTKRRDAFDQPRAVDTILRTQFASASLERSVRLEPSGNVGNLGFQGGVTYREFDDLRAGRPTGEQAHTGYQEIDGDARLQYRFAKGQEAAFSFQRVTQSRVPNTVAYTLDNESFLFDPQERRLYALEYRITELPFDLRHWHTSLSYQEQREVRRRQRFGSSVVRREKDSTETVGLTSVLSRPWFEHELVGGVEVYRDYVESSRRETDEVSGAQRNLAGAFPDGSIYNTLGLFLQADLDVGSLFATVGDLPAVPLHLILGGRYSRFSIDSEPPGFAPFNRSFDDTTGSVALHYRLFDGLALVGSAAQGFRAPNLDDTVVLRAVPEQGGVDTPNLSVGPERVINYEAGLKADLAACSASFFYFYSDYSDLIERRQIGFDDRNQNGMQDSNETRIFQRQNIGAAVVQGVEGDFVVDLWGGLEWRGNFSWIHGENTTADEPFSRIPPAMGLTGVRYDWEGWPLWAEYFVRLAGDQSRLSARDKSDRRIAPGGTPGWHTHNLRAGWRPYDWLDLHLALENLADEQYRTHGSGIDAPGVNVVAGLAGRF